MLYGTFLCTLLLEVEIMYVLVCVHLPLNQPVSRPLSGGRRGPTVFLRLLQDGGRLTFLAQKKKATF